MRQATGQHEIKSGYYELNRGMSVMEIVRIFNEGKVALRQVLRAARARTCSRSPRISRREGACRGKGFSRRLLRPGAPQKIQNIPNESFEGYLFPSTYFIARGHQAREYVDLMAGKFLRRFSSRADLEKRAKELGVHLNQLIAMASIVEKEASSPDETPAHRRGVLQTVCTMARNAVFRLQSCPTVIYAMTLERLKRRSTRPEHTGERPAHGAIRTTPTCTRAARPGPSRTPRKASMDAALYPSKVDYLFFCADNRGRNIFLEETTVRTSIRPEIPGGK